MSAVARELGGLPAGLPDPLATLSTAQVGTLGLAALAGLLVAAGVALAVRAGVSEHVSLVDAVTRLETTAPRRADQESADAADDARRDMRDRVGAWVARRADGGTPLRAPERELTLLRRSLTRYWGDKTVGLLLGLAGPAVLGGLWGLLDLGVPRAAPVALSLALGALGWFLPDRQIHAEAARARDEFRRAVACYVQLVALARAAGDGTQQALRNAAAAGDGWVFTRLRETLLRAELEGIAPWDGFTALAAEFDVPELTELADVMRLAGEEGSAVYDQLRARATSQQEAILSEDLARANAADERLTFPVTTLVLVFTVLLALPALARLLEPTQDTALPGSGTAAESTIEGGSP